MKKVILLTAIGIGAYFLLTGKKEGADTSNNSNDDFVRYNQKIVIDADGNWMIFFDGKIYTLENESAIGRFFAKYPGTPVENNTSLWKHYAALDNRLFAGTFNI